MSNSVSDCVQLLELNLDVEVCSVSVFMRLHCKIYIRGSRSHDDHRSLIQYMKKHHTAGSTSAQRVNLDQE